MAYGTPAQLYTSADLLDGYDPNDPMAFTKSWDFQTYRTYVADGGTTPKTLDIHRAQADHDAHIADALKVFLDREPKPKLVGIMGGHSLKRSDEAYRAVARLGRHLTQRGYLIVTGGGPGAMEAAHVGATFSAAGDAALEDVLRELSTVASLPKGMDDILKETGEFGPNYEEIARQARLWLNKAIDVRKAAPKDSGESLAIPTWVYGSEPSTPFASVYAKYFQNSIREEALVTQSRAGIVYAQGGGGTLREVFEDTEQNYYAKTAADFTPMIFFDPDGFWQRDATFDQAGAIVLRGLKLDDIIDKVFRYAGKPSATQKVKFTTDFNVIDSVLDAHAPAAQENLAFALASPGTISV